MTEAVAAVKPRSNKVMLASVLVFVLLVAFAGAFYFLGGAEIVSGLVGGLFAAAPAAAPASPAPSAGATSTIVSGSGLKLPDGVDEAFARRMYAEQLESQINIGKLIDGKVRSFAFGDVREEADKATVPLTVTFSDKTSAPGEMVLAKKGGKWYLESISGGRAGEAGGDADTVSTGVDEDDPAHVREAAEAEVDVAVLNTMLEQHAANQDVISAIVDGTYQGFTIDAVKKGAGTATLDMSLTGSEDAATKGHALCISKDIDGIEKWFVTSFTKA